MTLLECHEPTYKPTSISDWLNYFLLLSRARKNYRPWIGGRGGTLWEKSLPSHGHKASTYMAPQFVPLPPARTFTFFLPPLDNISPGCPDGDKKPCGSLYIPARPITGLRSQVFQCWTWKEVRGPWTRQSHKHKERQRPPSHPQKKRKRKRMITIV
jgi:hypothetical protein